MRFHTLIAALLMIALAVPAAGQSRLRDFDFAVGTNPYLTFSNPSFYNRLQAKSVSAVEASFAKEDGGLVSIDGSDNCLKAGAEMESYIKISERIAFHGGLSYSYFRGRNMGGPILVNPRFTPLNFYEQDNTTTGIKTRETYDLSGGMTYAFNEKWSAGVSIDYVAQNQVKRKDPRFLNYCMDMNLSAGFQFSPKESVSVGMNLIFIRQLQQLNANTYGTAEKQYKIMIDFGGFYGRDALLEGMYDYVAVSTVRPLDDKFYGGALQVVAGSKAKFFNEISFLMNTGAYGTKSSTTVLFTENKGMVAAYDGKMILPVGRDIHKVFLNARYQKLDNYVNSYAYKSEAGKVTTVEYYGQNKQLERNDVTSSLGYSWFGGIEEGLPLWEVNAVLDNFVRVQRTTIYPHYRDHNVINLGLNADAARNIILGRHTVKVGAQAGFFTGFGSAAKDGALASSKTTPLSYDNYLYQQFEYDTASRVSAGISLRYTCLVKDRFGIYVQLEDTFTSLLRKPQYLSGQVRNAALLSVGCNF